MEGLFIHKVQNNEKQVSLRSDIDESLSLIAKHGQYEIMTQLILKGSVVWLTPGVTEDPFEFFFVHQGKLEILDDEIPSVLGPGDSFFITRLRNDVKLRCLEDALVLYFSNCSVFEDEAYWQQNLQDLLNRIDEKDHYTKGHSYRVLEYSLKLREELQDRCKMMNLDDFSVACLFHDVGKCYCPSEILQKPSGLTNDEYNVIKKHPLDSYRILEPIFGEEIAKLARMHHERLDGRGYPMGLKADELPFEARIVMVADAFDAITSKRCYTNPRSYVSAAEELAGLPSQYDSNVAEALLRLVRDGRIALNPESRGRQIDEELR